MKTIYRFEGSDGFGVYSSNEVNGRLHDALNSFHNIWYAEQRPNISQDFNPKRVRDDPRSGTKSIKQLREWFDGGFFKKFLRAKTVKLVSYDVPSFLEGRSKKQIVFDYAKATNRKELSKGAKFLATLD